MLRNKWITITLWILGLIAFSAIVLKLDSICRQFFAFSILPYAIISAALVLLLIYFAHKGHSKGLKLTLSYLTIIPLCLIVSEAFFYYKLNFHKSTQVQPHAILGTSNTPESTTRQTLIVDDELIYDVIYTNDKNGLRAHNANATSANLSAKRCINIYGGSFVYGAGLDDSDTITAMLSKHTNFQANNFGISGGGGDTKCLHA